MSTKNFVKGFMVLKNSFRRHAKVLWTEFQEPLKTQNQTSCKSFIDSLGLEEQVVAFLVHPSALFEIPCPGHFRKCANRGLSLHVKSPASGVTQLGTDSFLLTLDSSLNHEDESCFLPFFQKSSFLGCSEDSWVKHLWSTLQYLAETTKLHLLLLEGWKVLCKCKVSFSFQAIQHCQAEPPGNSWPHPLARPLHLHNQPHKSC